MRELYDIAIVGGGISGIGVALTAKEMGYRSIILEREKILSATSANSLRIIHGGLRYLQQADLVRVCSSIKAQHELLTRYGAHIKPLRCLFPLEAVGTRTALGMRVAGAIYTALNRLSGIKSFTPTRILTAAQTQEFQLLRGRASLGAFEWQDALIFDLEKFHAQLRAEASEIIEQCGDLKIVEHSDRIDFELKDKALSAKILVDTRGPWANQSLSNLGPTNWSIQLIKAFNLVVRRELGQVAVALRSKTLGRQLFFVPRKNESGRLDTAIGTHYVKSDGPQSMVTSDEITQFLNEINLTAPELKLSPADIVSIEQGTLPGKLGSSDAAQLIGREQIVKRDRIVRVLSTKYTTFLSQGRQVVNLAKSAF